MRADSESAGHDTAPMTGPASNTPLEGLLLHAGFFPRAALPPPLPASDPSAAAASGRAASGLRGERLEDSGEAIAGDPDGGGGDGEEGEGVVAGTASDSPPRTMCDHGASDITQDLSVEMQNS